MIKFSNLNDAQKEAVIDESKHLRIVAGAGSGKTRVLTMRIAYLIEQKNEKPYSILAITFTNKAANEMKKRIMEMLGEKGDGCNISTIHSLCLRILKEEIEALGYPKNFTVVDGDDQKQILKEAYKLNNIQKNEISYSEVLDYIANNKYADISSAKAYELAYRDEFLIKKAKVFEYYEKRLKQIYALDFDDLILWTIKLFKLHPNVLEKWSKKFKYIHVDEFQDIDSKQYLLIKQLASYHDNIYVVGDPDQTIYTWRGADVNIIVNFDKDFKDTKTIILNQNYRSTNNILKGANSIIKNNLTRVPKELFSNNGDGDKIIHKSLDSEEYEAEYVVSEMKKLHRNGVNYKEIAVLYRSNYLSRNIEKKLIEYKIPYVIYGGIRFYERMEIKDILSYLRLIVTGDDLAFQRVINQPKRGIGQKSIDEIYNLAQKNNLSMYDVIKNGFYEKNQKAIDSFVEMVEKWRKDIDNLTIENIFNEVLDDSGYRKMLEDNNETERLENVKALVDDIESYQVYYPESDLEEYLQSVSLYTDKEFNTSDDYVNLLTIHAAKGLEFSVVFVIGLSEGIFPSQKTLNDGNKSIEEERRLAYVAYTRAKEKLYLTESSSFSFVLEGNKIQSRFINEIDDEYINHLNKKEIKSKIFDFSNNIDTYKNTQKVKEIGYSKGDLVIHNLFGEGIILGIDGEIIEVAFNYPHGIKKILGSHPSIRKKSSNDYH